MHKIKSAPNAIKILIVEDVEEERKLLAKFLLSKSYAVYLAGDDLSAIEIAQKIQPDLVLLDIFMPNNNGYTIFKQMRTIHLLKDTPVIFVTGASAPDERVKGLGLGAIDYITKPFDFKEVDLRLNIHLKHLKASNSPVNKAPDSPSSYAENLNKTLFIAAKDIFVSNLAVTPDRNELANSLRTNTARLNAAFKANCDMTVFAYLREMRMQQAKQLLSHSLLDISDIALSLGFNNPANFSTAFRKHFGISPREFRNRASND